MRLFRVTRKNNITRIFGLMKYNCPLCSKVFVSFFNDARYSNDFRIFRRCRRCGTLSMYYLDASEYIKEKGGE